MVGISLIDRQTHVTAGQYSAELYPQLGQQTSVIVEISARLPQALRKRLSVALFGLLAARETVHQTGEIREGKQVYVDELEPVVFGQLAEFFWRQCA